MNKTGLTFAQAIAEMDKDPEVIGVSSASAGVKYKVKEGSLYQFFGGELTGPDLYNREACGKWSIEYPPKEQWVEVGIVEFVDWYKENAGKGKDYSSNKSVFQSNESLGWFLLNLNKSRVCIPPFAILKRS